MKVRLAGKEIEVKIPMASPPDFGTTGSLTKLIARFKQQTMFIYDAVLTERRILIMGSKEFTTDKLGEFVSACAQMVSPPLVGM